MKMLLVSRSIALAIAVSTVGQALAQDAYYIGGQGNNLLTTGSNWVGGVAAADWQRLNFGSAVVSGTLNIDNFNGRSGVTVTSGLAQDMTIVDSSPLIIGTVLAPGNIDMSAATKNLTVNTSTWIWSNSEWNVGSGATLFMNGGITTNNGSAVITKTGDGNAWITAQNDLRYGVNVNGGGLVPLRGSLGTGPLVINNGGFLYVNDQWVFSGSNGFNVSYPNPSSATVNAGGRMVFDPSNGYANGITNLYLNGGSVEGATTQSSGALFLYNGNEQITAGGTTTSAISANIGVTGNNNSVTVDGGSTLNMTGTFIDNGFFGAGGIIKAGAGTLALSRANTYTGNTAVNGGTLQVAGAGSLGAGSYGGAISIATGANLQYSGTADQILSGVVSGAGSLTKDTGNSTLYLSGNNTYSGASTVSAGILKFANVAATGSTSGITVNNVGSVWFDPGTAGGTVTTPISLSGDGGGNCALNIYTPGSEVTFSGPVTLTNSSLVRSLGNSGTMSFTNAISGTGLLSFAAFSGGGGTKGTVVFSGSSDFSGGLALVNWFGAVQGRLSGGDNRLPTTALVTVHGDNGQKGSLDLNGNNQMIGGLTDSQGFGGMDPGARTVVNTSATPVTLTLNVASTQSSGVSIGGADVDGTVGNNLALVKMGNGSQTLSGAGSYTGGSTIQAGTLVLGNATALGATTGSLAVNGGTLDLAGFSPTFGTFSGSAGGVVTSASSATFTVSSSANSTYAGSITGGVALTKGGSGQFTLSGSNTYTGATTVSAGSFIVDGSLLNSAVTISPGATLKGHGTIGGSVSVLGTLSPGNSPGVISLGSVTLGGSSTTLIEINGTGRGTDYDGVNVTSSSGLTYGGLLSFNFGSLSPDFVTYHIFDFTGGFSGAFATVSSTGAYAGTWTDIGGGQFQLLSGPQTLTFTQSTGDVVVVPEPAAVAFVGVGTLLAGLVVRRRRKSA